MTKIGDLEDDLKHEEDLNKHKCVQKVANKNILLISFESPN